MGLGMPPAAESDPNRGIGGKNRQGGLEEASSSRAIARYNS